MTKKDERGPRGFLFFFCSLSWSSFSSLPHRKPFLPHKPRTPPRTPQQGSSTILFENRRRTIFYLVIVNCTIISQDTNGYQGRKQEGQGCPHSFQHSTQRCPHSGWGCWCRWQEGTAAAGWLFRWFIRTSRSDSTRYLPPLASCLLLLPPASCLLPPASCLHYSFSFIFFFFIFGLAVTNSLFSILHSLFSILSLSLVPLISLSLSLFSCSNGE